MYIIGTTVIAIVAYLLIVIVQLKVFAFDLVALRTIIAVTVELVVGVGAFLAALEMIQSAYAPIVEIHNELAKRAKDLPKMSVSESPKEYDEAIAKLVPLKMFVRRLRNRYLLIRSMCIYGFLIVLVVDLIVELIQGLLFPALASFAIILFAVEIAMIVEALSVFVLAIHIAVGYADVVI